ncbi:procollagen C-endopeptidase enhancer 2-like [Scyliorhinus canicula]|uniref:procollagen C-endopeptidase enhancer 2-like n=1 Tax=Scyliorhinus canicula TaxID=7830 RepID=UPI0018F64112|nr:procollagen C-endopeptidase enhancer 2-like [Scyliorhinus canicula]
MGLFLPLTALLIPALVKCQQEANSTSPTFPCGGQILGEQGYIASEGFPALYPSNKTCTWSITVPPGRIVILSFRHMDLETDPICRYDHVSVYNGNSASSERLGRFCGTFRPGAVMSTSNSMLIEMASDDDSAGKGFLAVYTARLPPEKESQFCGGKLVKPQGSFKTPNWPEKEYPTGITCSWHIVGRPNEYIELKFEKFGVESDNYCRYDYVAVFNGGRNDETLRAGKFCGDQPPDPCLGGADSELSADVFLCVVSTVRKGPAVCQTKCRRKGTLQSNFCASNFVITAKVLNLVPNGQSLQATVAIINTYKAGNLKTRQVGDKLITKILLVCRQCPNLRKGASYTLMGPVDKLGRGRILPNSFFLVYKAQQHQVLTKLTTRRC